MSTCTLCGSKTVNDALCPVCRKKSDEIEKTIKSLPKLPKVYCGFCGSKLIETKKGVICPAEGYFCTG